MQSRTKSIPASAWTKSSYSGANTSECVEVAPLPAHTAVRDSKTPDGPSFAVTHGAWTAFILAVQDGAGAL
ncbi:DUF397 domain-containing protein [Streptomyces sp. NPDC051561]|uniref:DUF397 domain-containing protein n=1 Tax=Streptomyces sp. NPDC051561 TaxID=3365658 RepID=UPI0037A06D9C